MSIIIKVAIADDISYFSQALQSVLIQEGTISVVKVINSFESLVDYCESGVFDILLLDVNFNQVNTLENIQLFRPDYKKFKVIVVTSLEKEYIKTLAHNANVSAFVSKNSNLDRLKGIIEHCFYNTSYYKMTPQEKTSVVINGVTFTERKIEVLKAIYEFSDLTDKEVASKLGIAYSSLKTHKRELFEMTNTKGVSTLIKYGLKNGVLL